jgi:2-C-methyl-D-erythritol 4-phosphate cytidylyltransferase
MNTAVAAVIAAAGASSRMGGVKKEYQPLTPRSPEDFDGDGKHLSVLGAAALAFASSPRIRLLVIVFPAEGEGGNSGGESAVRASLHPRLFEREKPLLLFVPGGPSRRASVHRALSLLENYNPAYVLIHDGARPWVDAALIERTIDAAIAYRAVVPVLPLTETPKELDEAGFVRRHLKRAQVGGAQTPQGFAFPDILRAHEEAEKRERLEGIEYTDDAEVWGEFRGPVAVIPGSPANRKITYLGDLPGGYR